MGTSGRSLRDVEEELGALRRRAEKLDNDIAARDAQAEALVKRRAESEKRDAIEEALRKHGALNPHRDAVLFDHAVNKSGEFVVPVEDAVLGGHTDVPLGEYVAEFLKSAPELTQAAAAARGPVPIRPGPREIPPEQWRDFEWMKAHHEKFISGEWVRQYPPAIAPDWQARPEPEPSVAQAAPKMIPRVQWQNTEFVQEHYHEFRSGAWKRDYEH